MHRSRYVPLSVVTPPLGTLSRNAGAQRHALHGHTASCARVWLTGLQRGHDLDLVVAIGPSLKEAGEG